MIGGRSVDGSFYSGGFRPTAMSCDTCAVRIKQRYEPIRILRAERVVQAAGNIEPVYPLLNSRPVGFLELSIKVPSQFGASKIINPTFVSERDLC